MSKFLCCSLLALTCGLQAEGLTDKQSSDVASSVVSDDASQTELPDSAAFDAAFNSSAEDYDGFTIGIGLNVGVSTTNIDANREFEAPTRVRATTFGGTVAFGYQRAVCGNFMMGFEIGADIGGAGKHVRAGGKIRDNSWMMAAYREDYSIKEGILRQMFDNIGGNLRVTFKDTNGYAFTTDTYSNFILTMRYLGGAENPPSGNFLTDEATGNRVYNPGNIGYEPNEEAVFADFIAPLISADSQVVAQVCADNIRNLGNGDPLNGYQEMRKFIGAYFPLIADALRNMATAPSLLLPYVAADGAVNGDSGAIDDTSGNIVWDVADQLDEFFSGEYFEYEDIGIDSADERALNNLKGEIDNLYNPDNSRVSPRLSSAEIKALDNFKSKTSFGVCPYAAIKIGYFVNEIKGLVYGKVGIMQLQGHVDTINDFMEKKDKIHTIAPLIAIGVSKMLDKNFCISVECSHTLKTSKKFKDIEWRGYRIENRVNFSKTDFRVQVTYAL